MKPGRIDAIRFCVNDTGQLMRTRPRGSVVSCATGLLGGLRFCYHCLAVR
jgi:hypothetical protein